MGQKVAGTCYVKVDGTQLTLKGGAEAPLMDKTRETVVPGFFKEEDKAPFVKITPLLTSGFPLQKLVEGTDMTVTVEFKSGRVYTLSGAYLVAQPTGKGDEGTTELQFDGIKGVWS
ncbi:phage tail tube protein [Pseudomonas sp. RIT-PI-S]|uniref:phage tail tube protein n=1 Tax=Pseudomonas sp. RIT-PI-S TaxID=3035295 RepID=UPI0021DA8A7E|nr:phage tail tube protein [Pseudomonas sp. RIT-PI-S]